MFSQPKQEEQIQLRSLFTHPLSRKFFCPQHAHIYQYHCIHDHCLGFICGKIECVDQHFHGSKLNIQRFNVNPFMEKIKRFESLQNLGDVLSPTLSQLKNSVEQLKVMSANVFKLYKELKSTADFLVSSDYSPLTPSYLQRMDDLQTVSQNIQIQIRSMSQIINWKNIWINLQDELQIIQKLKISFSAFKQLYFEPHPVSDSDVINQWAWLQQQVCQGVIFVYFTEDQLVMGKYISNNNIETCRLFIRDFSFIVNHKGQIYQRDTIKSLISIHKAGNQYFLQVNDSSFCERERISRQQIKRVVCLKAFPEQK